MESFLKMCVIVFCGSIVMAIIDYIRRDQLIQKLTRKGYDYFQIQDELKERGLY